MHVCLCRRRQWHPTPVLLPGKSHGQRSLVGYSPWGRWELDMTQWLHFHFSLSCIGEGNGNPLQCSWWENPRDSTTWWAAIYGVAQSRTQLKRLSSSSSWSIVFLVLAWSKLIAVACAISALLLIPISYFQSWCYSLGLIPAIPLLEILPLLSQPTC